jgi:hypothetical protein
MLYRGKSVAFFDESSQNTTGWSNPIKVLKPIDVDGKLDPDEAEVLASSSVFI